MWLAITYKANFANVAAANGWLGRAQRLLEPLEPGPLHGWVLVARGYRMTDLDLAEDLSEQAAAIARSAGDVDLELVARSQVGLVRVGKGDVDAGFRLLDEAMAAALGGERSTLDTVVYACCDMLNACELASDIERATYFACGDLDELTTLFEQAQLDEPATSTHLGTIRFPSVEALVTTELDSTPLGGRLTAEQRDQILAGARRVLAPFTKGDGSLEAPFRAHIVVSRRT